jgi:hypothetical protein
VKASILLIFSDILQNLLSVYWEQPEHLECGFLKLSGLCDSMEAGSGGLRFHPAEVPAPGCKMLEEGSKAVNLKALGGTTKSVFPLGRGRCRGDRVSEGPVTIELLIVKEKWLEGLSHVVLNVVGEHTEKYMRPDVGFRIQPLFGFTGADHIDPVQFRLLLDRLLLSGIGKEAVFGLY